MIAAETPAERISGSREQRSISSATLAGVAVYFILSGAIFVYAGIERLANDWYWLDDLHYFYRAAVLLDNGQPDLLYDTQARVALGFSGAEGWEVFPYPAGLALLYEPLTSMDYQSARFVFAGLSVAALLGVVAIAYRWSRDGRFALLLLLAIATHFTVYEVIRFSQLAPILALITAAAVVSIDQMRPVRGAIFTGLLAFKPSLFVAPLALLIWRLRFHWAALAVLFMGALILVAAQVWLVGGEGIRLYLEQLGRYRDEAFVLDGQFTAGAGWMLNWNGFIGRLFVVDPQPWMVVPFWIATAAALAAVWLRQDTLTCWLAGSLATLIIVPHVLWYEWVILFGVAPFVLYRNRSPMLLPLMLALHFSVSLDSYFTVTNPAEESYVFFTTLVAASILVYLAATGHRVRLRAGL